MLQNISGYQETIDSHEARNNRRSFESHALNCLRALQWQEVRRGQGPPVDDLEVQAHITWNTQALSVYAQWVAIKTVSSTYPQ